MQFMQASHLLEISFFFHLLKKTISLFFSNLNNLCTLNMGYIFIHKHTERNKKKKNIFFSIKVQRRTTPICEVLPISVCIVYKLRWIPGRLFHQ